MKKFAVLFGFVAIVVLVIGVFKFNASRADNLGKSLMNIGLSGIARGYKCHEDGLTLEQCQQIQKDRWSAVDRGAKETDLPAFTKP
jgi:hypothetical protein